MKILAWMFDRDEQEARHIERHYGCSGIPPAGWRFTSSGKAYRVDCCGYPVGSRAQALEKEILRDEGLKRIF